MKSIAQQKLKEFFGPLRTGAGMLVVAAVGANFLNLAFNIYLGRRLDLSDFGIVTTMSTLVYVLNIFISSMGTTITRAVSYFEGEHEGKGSFFFRNTWMHILVASVISSIGWVITVPFIAHFLNVPSYLIIMSFAPAIFFGTLNAFNNGYLQGMFSFGMLALITTIEALSKLILAVALVHWFDDYAAFAIPGSILFAWAGSAVCAYIVYSKTTAPATYTPADNRFPLGFYGAALMRSFSVTAFLSFDVILAKHYLSPEDAGRYAMIALVGKMIYFFGTLLNAFIVTLVSRAEGKHRDPSKDFIKIFTGTAFLTVAAGTGLMALGWFLVPLLFGPSSRAILSYLPRYSIAMMLFTLSTTVVLYELARKKYLFPMISLVMSGLMIVAIFREHDSIGNFIHAIFVTNVIYFAVIMSTAVFYSLLKYSYRNIRDIIGVFGRMPAMPEPAAGYKKILIFNWRDTESVFAGGAETYIHNLARRWVAEGHSVTLFTSNDGKQEQNGTIDGVRIIRRGGFFAVYITAALYYILRFRGKFDVIIDCENGIPFFTPLYVRKPVFCLVHHIHQEVFRKALILPLAVLAQSLEKYLMPLVYRHCTFITVSESSKCDMEKLRITDKSIEVIYPGVDLDLLSPGPKSPTPLVSYVGRLKDYKSVDVLIKAFAQVVAEVPEARLVIAGDGDAEKGLKRLTTKLGLDAVVTFKGKVSDEEKRDILQQSWVFVNPSMMEGWGITTIEANACGTPVVASDVPGLRDSVRNNETGILVPYGDVNLFAQEILHILGNEAELKTLSKNALVWSQSFEWQKSGNRFIDIISQDEILKIKSMPLGAPSIVHIFFGALVSMFVTRFRKSQLKIPARINSYNLISEIKKKDQIKNMAIGIFELNGQKFLIKVWEGSVRDLNYYALVNEYLVNRLLSKRASLGNIKTIKFPAGIGYFKTRGSLIVVFEYIEGTLLNFSGIEKQAQVITSTLDSFRVLSSELGPTDRAQFGRRSHLYFVALLPIVSFLSLVADIRNWKIILRSCYMALRISSRTRSKDLTLAHRDITPSNIMLSADGGIYILDSENMVLTVPGYDYAYLSVSPGQTDVARLLPECLANENTYFLKNYIVLHHILGSGNFFKVNMRYVKLLYELNA